MLNIPSKIAKSALCDTIDLNLNDVLHQNQLGYRKGISSESLFCTLLNLGNIRWMKEKLLVQFL